MNSQPGASAETRVPSLAPGAQSLPPAAELSTLQSEDPKLHTEIRAVLELYKAHSEKIYFSGPLVRKCERNPSGQSAIVDECWEEVWAQLGGTDLSIWVMKEVDAASKEGRQVPPLYTNVTDSFTQILGSLTTPATSRPPLKRYSNIFTLNTAGSNLYLFSCPNSTSLVSWTAAVRLAAWERSRLEEIYTASLLRTTLATANVPTSLDGNFEGWAWIRTSGQTEWRKVWLVVQAGVADYDPEEQSPPAPDPGPLATSPISTKNSKKRMSNVFSFQTTSTDLPPLLPRRLVSVYDSPKAKHQKKPPLFTLSIVRQAYAVYPERPELIEASSLIKVVGVVGEVPEGRRMAKEWKGKGENVFMLVLPDGGSAEMSKWIVAFHDAFELYGRPREWNWDRSDPVSLLFGCPVGPKKADLFLDRTIAESIDPRGDIAQYHAAFKRLLRKHKFPSQ